MFSPALEFSPSWGITLPDGREVRLDYFLLMQNRILAGEWLPPVEEQLEGALNDLTKLWGKDRPVIVIPPVMGGQEIGYIRGPRYRCMAWLSSSPMTDTEDGSHLFFIWWQEMALPEMAKAFEADCPTPLEAIHRILQRYPWEDHARDFTF